MNRLVSENELRHYGVPGMRWGRGRKRTTTTTTSTPKKRRMSNKELQSRVKRLELEKKYKDLSAPPKTQSKIDKLIKGMTTVNSVADQGIKIYKNVNEIMVLVDGAKKAAK